MGSIQLENSDGTADLHFSISGPKGEATLYVVGEKRSGEWTYETLVVEIRETGQEIDIKR